MLPEFKSGKINIFASPATLELGAFLFATEGIMAASNWRGPSMSNFGLIALTSFKVSNILPTWG